MDHDAMAIDVRKLKEFRADIMLLFPGGEEGFKAHVAARRAGDVPPLDMPNPSRALTAAEPESHGELLETVKDLSDHLLEVSEAVTSLQQFESELRTVILPLAGINLMQEWFVQHREALEGLIAGGQKPAGAVSETKGHDGASGTGQAPETAPQPVLGA